MNYKIKKISEVNTELLNKFYKIAFPFRFKNLTNHWKWYYRIGHTNFEPLILEYDSKIIGMAGLIPVELKFKEKTTDAIWFTDFFVLKEFRKKGLGSVLTKEWMDLCPLQITFCNDESLKIFKKFKWKNNNDTYRNIKPLNFFKLMPIVKKFNINIQSKLFKKILNKNTKESKIIEPNIVNNKSLTKYCKLEEKKILDNELFSIVRDEEWFKWRLIECPYNSDIYEFNYDQDVFICHIFKSNNLKRLNILYTYIHNPKNTEIFNLIFNWCSNNNIDFIWSISSSKNKIFKETALDDLFFKKKINYACWAKDIKKFSHLEKGLSNSQGSDSDLDSILYQDE